jgi:2-dehydropantoate 2-reductase
MLKPLTPPYACELAPRYIPDLWPTATLLSPLLTHSATFVLIQNGIGVHEELRSILPDDVTIISGCAWVDATILDGGKILKHGRLVSAAFSYSCPCR